MLPEADTAEHKKQRIKMLNDYWKNEDNYLMENRLIIIDDEDFITGTDFACMFNHDKTNYYLSIGRMNLSTIGVSVEAIYTLRSAAHDYWLEQFYKLDINLLDGYDYYLVEGSGSEYCLFSYLLGSKTICPTYKGRDTTGGRTKIAAMLREYPEFNGSKILCFVDICAFGANIEELLSVCETKI